MTHVERLRPGWVLTVVGAVVISTSACGPTGTAPSPALAPTSAPVATSTAEQPKLSDIVTCALSFITPKFASNPNGLQRAAELLDRADQTKDVTAAALYVYGRSTTNELTNEEQNDLILIIAGIDSCGNLSDPLRQSADGILTILRTLPARGPQAGGAGQNQAVLCPGIDPFGPSANYRFEPDCKTVTTTTKTPAGDVPSAFLGDWNGSITQKNPPIPAYTISVHIRQGTKGSTIATGHYTGTDPCNIHWVLQAAESSQLIVNEVVESGNCFSNIKITIAIRGSGTLSYNFENGNGQGILNH